MLVVFSLLVGVTGACSSAKDDTRVPLNHRLTGSVCPQDRGAGVGDVGVCGTGAPFSPACLEDATCTAGTNGRCLASFGPACNFFCSYDDCFADSDCAGNVPCACRSSASDSEPNTCATASSCRVDTDCGPGGFCSPSLVGDVCECVSESFCQRGNDSCGETTNSVGVTVAVSCLCTGNCGHGYFCHTPKDGCVDDSDCPNGRTCNYDLTSQSWMCTGCVHPP